MAKFITGIELNFELEKIFKNAEEIIILISPYIKLHEHYKSVLSSKKDNSELRIIVVFGKNEDDISKSMNREDFAFFKEFPNIEIRYEKRLHAKYFANEKEAILTSMNLYSFSQNNNIEFGISTKKPGFISGDDIDAQAWNYFNNTVINQARILFAKSPEYGSTILGYRKYKGSNIETDDLSDFYSKKGGFNYSLIEKSSHKSEKIKLDTEHSGFCIRTGKKIPFNPERPMSDEAYESWVKFKNEDYPEKFCHFSGEKSNGETSFAKPILRKNWKKAQAVWSKLKK